VPKEHSAVSTLKSSTIANEFNPKCNVEFECNRLPYVWTNSSTAKMDTSNLADHEAAADTHRQRNAAINWAENALSLHGKIHERI